MQFLEISTIKDEDNDNNTIKGENCDGTELEQVETFKYLVQLGLLQKMVIVVRKFTRDWE